MTVEKAITELQEALEPVTTVAPTTHAEMAAQCAEQIRRYHAAAANYEAAVEAVRKAVVANGPKPEFVRGA